MPIKSSWIILFSEYLPATYVTPEADFWHVQISPNYELKRGDDVYLWSKHANGFVGWGEIAEPPQTFVIPETKDSPEIKKQRIVIKVKHEFDFPITEQMMLSNKSVRKLVPTEFNDLRAIPLRPGQANYLNDFIREYTSGAPQGSATVNWSVLDNASDITVQAILTFGNKTDEGSLITDVGIAWDEIIKIIKNDPEEIYKIDPFKFEEIIAGAYEREGYEVILTPRSGDKGRDVIATRRDGAGSIRIFDQVKRYAIHNPVSANDVRALVGVLTTESNVSKGVITTTSIFAPEIYKDEGFKKLMPHRLELKDKNMLLPWLEGLRRI